MKKRWVFSIMAACLFCACEDLYNEGQSRLKIKLIDAPGQYEEVLINIEEVQIHISKDGVVGPWKTLNEEPLGVYNLLEYTNGKDVTLIDEALEPLSISQMRLVLGDSNKVKVDGKYFNLEIPSDESSGAKFNFNESFKEGSSYKIWIDFDAGRSIIKTAEGKYLLKPVIRAYSDSKNSTISGSIDPVNAFPYIMVVSAAKDTFATFADKTDGHFQIGGLNTGSYDIIIEPTDEFEKLTIENINVKTGQVKNLGNIEIEYKNL